MINRRTIGHLATALVMSGALSMGVVALAATPAAAYGRANWQITFAGTATGYGFWGWCDFAGGTTPSSGLATSGTTGDCQFSEYVHQPGVFSGTCESSLTLTAWYEAPGFFTPTLGDADWFFSGTAVTHPAGQTAFCQTLPGVPPPAFSNFDSVLPVAVGHTSENGLVLPGGFTFRELQFQETPLS